MSFVGDFVSDVTGKPDPDTQENATNASTAAQQWATQMAKDYYDQTAGLRSGAISRLTNFMQGNYDPTASALYAPIKNTAEQAFNTSMTGLMSKLPSGGALEEGISNLYATKANTLSNLIGSIVQDEYAKAFAMAQGTPSAASSLLQSSGAGSSIINALAQQTGAGAQTASNIGQTGAGIASLIKYLGWI